MPRPDRLQLRPHLPALFEGIYTPRRKGAALRQIDQVRRPDLLKEIEQWSARFPFTAVVPISAKNGEQVDRLQQAMENTELFPNMVIQMIAVGEESGSLDEMSAKVADFYEEEVDNAVDNLSSLLEPLIMAILGVLVGGVVVAMYLQIFKIVGVV